jgi:hypothetical protein
MTKSELASIHDKAVEDGLDHVILSIPMPKTWCGNNRVRTGIGLGKVLGKTMNGRLHVKIPLDTVTRKLKSIKWGHETV